MRCRRARHLLAQADGRARVQRKIEAVSCICMSITDGRRPRRNCEKRECVHVRVYASLNPPPHTHTHITRICTTIRPQSMEFKYFGAATGGPFPTIHTPTIDNTRTIQEGGVLSIRFEEAVGGVRVCERPGILLEIHYLTLMGKFIHVGPY